jgi:hypothetical protein
MPNSFLIETRSRRYHGESLCQKYFVHRRKERRGAVLCFAKRDLSLYDR